MVPKCGSGRRGPPCLMCLRKICAGANHFVLMFHTDHCAPVSCFALPFASGPVAVCADDCGTRGTHGSHCSRGHRTAHARAGAYVLPQATSLLSAHLFGLCTRKVRAAVVAALPKENRASPEPEGTGVHLCVCRCAVIKNQGPDFCFCF